MTLLAKVPQRTRPNIQMTPRDHEIRSTLALKINFVEVSQAARTWWRDSASGRECAAERLGRLAKEGYLVALRLRVHPELSPEKPVCTWRPGDPVPAFGTVSYQLRARWTEPLRWIMAYAASERSAKSVAGHGGLLPRPLQATHDLHVAAVYLRTLKENPAEARGWVSDHALAARRRGRKLPDAEIQDADGRTLKVIEFGGSYPAERVQKVHEDCELRKVPYELW